MSGQIEEAVTLNWSNVLKRPPHESTFREGTSIGAGFSFARRLRQRSGAPYNSMMGNSIARERHAQHSSLQKDLVLRVVLEDRAEEYGIKQGDPVEYFLPFSALGGISFIEPRPERPKS